MANSSIAVRMLPEPERTLAFGGISGVYAKVGTPLIHAAIEVVFQNLTDGTISFSWDGINSAITLGAFGTYTTDIQANKGRGEAMMIAEGTQFWVKQVEGPTEGSVYISVFYAALSVND